MGNSKFVFEDFENLSEKYDEFNKNPENFILKEAMKIYINAENMYVKIKALELINSIRPY